MQPQNVCLFFLYNDIDENSHSKTNFDQSQSFIEETSIKAPKYLGLGRVFKFGHRKVDSATTMKQRKTSSSHKLLANNLVPKLLMRGREVSLIFARNLDFADSSCCCLMSSPPIGIPKKRCIDFGEKSIVLFPTIIAKQFTSTSASHCTKFLGTLHPSYSSKIRKPRSLIICFLCSSNTLTASLNIYYYIYLKLQLMDCQQDCQQHVIFLFQ